MPPLDLELARRRARGPAGQPARGRERRPVPVVRALGDHARPAVRAARRDAGEARGGSRPSWRSIASRSLHGRRFHERKCGSREDHRTQTAKRARGPRRLRASSQRPPAPRAPRSARIAAALLLVLVRRPRALATSTRATGTRAPRAEVRELDRQDAAARRGELQERARETTALTRRPAPRAGSYPARSHFALSPAGGTHRGCTRIVFVAPGRLTFVPLVITTRSPGPARPARCTASMRALPQASRRPVVGSSAAARRPSRA